jgi:aminoglycoside 3-N-acetyltransferase
MQTAQPISVTQADLQYAIRSLNLAGQAVCVHSSLRSFGRVAGGAQAVVQAFLAEGCTLLVPAHTYDFAVFPPPALQVPRNGWNYALPATSYALQESAGQGEIYTPATKEIDPDMGAIPAAVVNTPGSARGDHALNSFAAVGPLAEKLIMGQKPLAVFAPLQALIDEGGYVLLMGVALDKMTMLHYAEQMAGREPFRRWANDREGQPQMVQAGSCSDGFERLASVLEPWQREAVVGKSVWHLFPAFQALQAATAAIRDNPQITDCGDPTCERCRDARLGGPILA